MIRRFILGLVMSATLTAVSASAQSITYVHTDVLGSPVLESDAAGTVTREVDFRPYGSEVLDSPTNGPAFTGHYRDSRTGLVYAQQRYYDSGLGLFLSIDPVAARTKGDNFNRYWYAKGNPYTNTDPDGRECNGKGCWVTPEERKAAVSGNWREYYRLAGGAGDEYAKRAGEVASNTGSTPLNAVLSAATNSILAGSIAEEMDADPANLTMAQVTAIEFKIEAIRVGLAKAHVQALDDAKASPDNPVSLDRSVIGEFHRTVFAENGANPDVFGGFKVDAMEDALNEVGVTTRDVYDYCPSPSCKN